MLLSEKYRPKKLKEVIGNKDIIEIIKENTNMPNLLFIGPPGCGKSTIAKILAKEHENVIHLNAGDERGINIVRNKIKDFTHRKNSLVILDECENLTKAAQQALRKIVEDNKSIFIFICNKNKMSEALQSRCSIFNFESIKEDEIFLTVQKIAHLENISVKNEEIKLLIDYSKGDMRKVLNNLEILKYNNNLSDILGIPDYKMIEKVLKMKNYKNMISILNILKISGFEPSEIISTFFSCAKNLNDNKICNIVARTAIIINNGGSFSQLHYMLKQIVDL